MINNLFTKRKFVLLLITVAFLLITSFFYENKVSYIHFVDEEENMVTGKYLLEGDKLYSDVFATHQPLSYISSTFIQKITNPTSIFLLIKRHREFIIIWSLIWAFLLVYRFGVVGLGFSAIFETTKIFLLGNLFLSESLIVYPLIYLMSFSVFKIKKVKSLEVFFLGFLFSVCVFLLAPAWPLIAFLFLVIFIKNKLYSRWKLFALGFLAVIILILPFVSVFPDYFRDTFFFNIKYFIPLEQNDFNFFSITRSFVSFMTVFASGQKTSIIMTIRLLSLTLVFYFMVLAKRKEFKKLVFFFIALGLANIRYVEPGLDFYRGFHLIVWYSVLILSVSYLAFYLIRNSKSKIFRLIIVGAFFVPLLSSLYISRDELFKKRDVANDYYINYSRQFDLGEAVRIMKSEGDTLFVAPDESLIFWQADIDRATKYVFYYPFMTDIPFTWDEVRSVFQNNPPTFFYCRCEKEELVALTDSYTEIKKDDEGIYLFVLPEILKSLTEEQREQLNYYKFNY